MRGDLGVLLARVHLDDLELVVGDGFLELLFRISASSLESHFLTGVCGHDLDVFRFAFEAFKF